MEITEKTHCEKCGIEIANVVANADGCKYVCLECNLQVEEKGFEFWDWS